jgi:hypothetical protein
MSKMNFNLNVEDPNKGKGFPWLTLLVVAAIAAIAVWALEPAVVGILRSG